MPIKRAHIATTLKIIVVIAVASLSVFLGVHVVMNYAIFIRSQFHDSTSKVDMQLPSNSPTSIPTAIFHPRNITSIEFNVTDMDPTNVVFGAKWSYYVKNYGTPDLEFRAQCRTSTGLTINIINGVEKNSWIFSNGQWKEFPPKLIDYYNLYQHAPIGPIKYYIDAIAANWTGSGNFIYTYSTRVENPKVIISDIVLNPVLPDSLFLPSRG